MKPDYVDVLLVTALVEERYLLDRVFPQQFERRYGPAAIECLPDVKIHLEGRGHKADSQKTAGFVVIKRSPGSYLRVAWTNLEGPGNVWAYDETSQLVELLSPRFVMLLGLAGGNTDEFKRGDVGYGDLIGNSSYGKLESETIAQRMKRIIGDSPSQQQKDLMAETAVRLSELGIDAERTVFTDVKLRSSENVEASRFFCNAVDNQSKYPQEWQHLAETWHSEFEAVYHQEEFAFDKAKNERYPEQKKHENLPPRIRRGVVASGDSVVASRDLQRLLGNLITLENARRKEDVSANMYEMEAYGVGLCCQRRSTNFGMLKGISDLAGEDKSATSKDKDAFRLAAIASASAVAFCVLGDDAFVRTVLSHRERYAWSQSACIVLPQSKVESPVLRISIETRRRIFHEKAPQELLAR